MSDNYDIKDINQAEGGRRRIEWAEREMPVLRAIKGGKAAPAKAAPVKPATTAKPVLNRPAMKPVPAAADDVPVIALNLETAKLSPAMAAYFKKCQDKLGFIPNVLLAYAFDMTKLETFVAMYNDLMLGDSGLSKLEREMIAVAVSSQNRCYYCLTAHGAAVRQYSGNPLLGEHLVMNYRVARLNKRQRAIGRHAPESTNREPERVIASQCSAFGGATILRVLPPDERRDAGPRVQAPANAPPEERQRDAGARPPIEGLVANWYGAVVSVVSVVLPVGDPGATPEAVAAGLSIRRPGDR